MIAAFTLAGEPVSKQRPRFTKTGRTYTPEATLTAEKKIGFSFRGVNERERRAMIRRREKGLASQPASEVAKPQKKTPPPRRLGQVQQMHEQGASVSFIAASLNIRTESVHQNLRRNRAKASA